MQASAEKNKNLVELKDIHFSYGSRAIFDGLDLDVAQGKVTVIMGPSGSGKSTLLKFIGGRLKPKKGQVLFDGINVPKLRRGRLFELRKRMGMMFQQNALLTDLNVFENVAYPLREHTDLPESLIKQIVLLKLETVGLRGTKDLMPDELSGGMARRIALARAISLEPDLIMYDEPFTGLDPTSMAVAIKLIKDLNDALGCTSIVVTHDVQEGASIADYMYVIGNGKTLGHGTPDELFNSSEETVYQFLNGLPDGPIPFHYPAVDIAQELINHD